MTAQQKVVWIKMPSFYPFNTGTPPKRRFPRPVVDKMNTFSSTRRGRMLRHNK